MKKIITISSIFTVIFLVSLSTQNSSTAHSAGAPNGYTGAPMDNSGSTCESCHTGSSVTLTTGVISSDVPASGFVAGTTYNFTVALTGTAAYGFEVSAQTPISSSAVGTLIANDPTTQISGNYITHNPKIVGTSASWRFQWTAPLTGTTVTIYGAFNYANNNLNTSGDLIRTSSVTYTQCASVASIGIISGNTADCSGSSNTYSVSPVSGAISYSWILPSGWTGSSLTNTISAMTSTSSGIIFVSANNSCGSSASQTLAVTVNSILATPSAISGNTTVCSGSSNTYSVSAVSGATSYSWILPSGWSGTSTTNSISTVAGTSSGIISITANNSCGSSLSKTLAVTVNFIPATPSAISGNTIVCLGSSNTYSVSAVSGATSYNWILPSGWSGTSTTNTISAMASTSSGIISITANNSCGSSLSKTIAVTVNSIPATPSAISGNTIVCSGGSNTYSVSVAAGATSYNWIFPSGWSGTSTTNTISTIVGTSSGIISITANNSCGSSSSQTLAVTVSTSSPSSPLSISGNTTVCANSSNTYSVSLVSGATSYNWTLPSGWSGTSTSNIISSVAGTVGGIISVSASNICGASLSQTLAVTVSGGTALPQPGLINGNIIICSGSSNTYSVSAVGGATSYSWILPSGWAGTSTTNTISTMAGTSSGIISITANNSCGSSASQTLAVTVNSIPAAPSAISGNTTVCSGSSNTYSISAGGGATSYNWILPSSWSGSSFSNTISTTASSTGGNISVFASNSCGISATQTLAITVNSIPVTPSAISGNTTVCSGSSNTYSVSAVGGATSYSWILPSGWSGNSSTNIMSAMSSTSSGMISVTANNSCGSSSSQTLVITMNTIDVSVTQNGLTLSANLSGAVYQWINCSTSSNIFGATAQNYTATANGIYKVTITNNGCSASSSCYTVNTVGMTENNSLISSTIYPNPSNGKFQLNLSDIQFGKKYELEIYNVDGTRIYHADASSITTEVDIGNQSIGIYVMKIYDAETSFIIKIVKEK